MFFERTASVFPAAEPLQHCQQVAAALACVIEPQAWRHSQATGAPAPSDWHEASPAARPFAPSRGHLCAGPIPSMRCFERTCRASRTRQAVVAASIPDSRTREGGQSSAPTRNTAFAMLQMRLQPRGSRRSRQESELPRIKRQCTAGSRGERYRYRMPSRLRKGIDDLDDRSRSGALLFCRSRIGRSNCFALHAQPSVAS